MDIKNKAKKAILGIYDGLENVVAGLGTSKDKRVSTEFTEVSLDDAGLETMYTSDWLSGKIVDCPADDMTRNWRKILCEELSPEDLELFEEYEMQIDYKKKINEALKLARLYGGSVIYFNLADNLGSDELPLDYEQVGTESLISLMVFDRTQLKVTKLVQDIQDPFYNQPEFYQIKDSKVDVHHTRIARFDGLYSPWNIRKKAEYWHGSVLKRAYEAILNSQSSANSVNSIIYEASVGVVKVPNLFDRLARKGGNEELLNRFKLADLMKSFNNSLILDAKEDYQRVSASFAGLPDLLIKYLNIAAGASDIPATRLLGQSAQGLNATGEGDLNNYYDMLSGKQENDLKPQMHKIDKVVVPSILGSMPETWGFEFNSLYQLDDLQMADKELKDAQKDKIYYETGTLPASIIAKQLKKNGTYSEISDEYITSLEATEGEIDSGTTE